MKSTKTIIGFVSVIVLIVLSGINPSLATPRPARYSFRSTSTGATML
jgi:hypothetical protein